MKFKFGKINLNFENIHYSDDKRARRLTNLIFNLLDEKLDTLSSDSTIGSANNNIILDHIVIPNVTINPERSDYEIAYRCASAIYQAILDKLR